MIHYLFLLGRKYLQRLVQVEEVNYQSQAEEGKLQCLGLGGEVEDDALEEELLLLLVATQVTQLREELVQEKAWVVQLGWS